MQRAPKTSEASYSAVVINSRCVGSWTWEDTADKLWKPRKSPECLFDALSHTFSWRSPGWVSSWLQTHYLLKYRYLRKLPQLSGYSLLHFFNPECRIAEARLALPNPQPILPRCKWCRVAWGFQLLSWRVWLYWLRLSHMLSRLPDRFPLSLLWLQWFCPWMASLHSGLCVKSDVLEYWVCSCYNKIASVMS